MINKRVSNYISWNLIAFGILFLNSCSTSYYVNNASQRLYPITVDAKTNSRKVNSEMKLVLEDRIIAPKSGNIFGQLSINGNYTQYRDLVCPFLNVCSATVLQFMGFPWGAGNVKLKDCVISLKDVNGNLIKKYGPYSVKKSYVNFYYGVFGLTNEKAQQDIARGIIKKFADELKNDISRINQQLDSVYYISHPRPAPKIVQTQPQQSHQGYTEKDLELAKLQGQLEAMKTNFANTSSVPAAAPQPARILSDVDQNIPITDTKAENTFVLIIANEDYKFVDKVAFAKNDGSTFKEYCIKTLGVPEKQVWLYEDASYGIINAGISQMVTAMNMFDKPNAIVYYCGHGIPDEKTGDAYIIPTDGKGTNIATCYSLNTLYKTLAATKAANVTYFMDACFTGASKSGSMIVAARGVAREPRKDVLSGNTVVFSAASADETAMTYKEKQHGLFTYFLLKKLQETKGNASYEELANYISSKVKKEAFLTNEKPQNPVVATSIAVQNNWKSMKLK